MPVDRNRLPPLRTPTVLHFPQIACETLGNGIQLRVVQDKENALVTFVLLLRTGSTADPVDCYGLAGLTAALVSEGSASHTTRGFYEALGDIGGFFGADATSDSTVLSITALARYADQALALLVDVTTKPRFDDEDVERVRNLRLNRIAQLRHSAVSVADRAFLHALYGSHPYGHLPIGTVSGLKRITSDEIHEFHERYYRPEQWRLVAVGDVCSSDLANIVEKITGDLDELSVAQKKEDIVPGPPGCPVNRIVFVPRKGSVQTELRLGLVGVSRHCPDLDALTVMNTVLGGQFVSRLNLNLREDKGFTYGVHSSFDARRGSGPFTIQAAVDVASTADAIREIVREIRDIRSMRPITKEELKLARSSLTRGFSRSYETSSQVARAAMRLALFDLPDDEYTTFVPRINRVGSEDVTKAAADYLDDENLIAVVVGPPIVAESLGDLGFGSPSESLID